MYKILGLIVSVLLHVLIVFFIFYKPTQSIQVINESSNTVQVRLLSKKSDDAYITVGEGINPSPKSDKEICENKGKEYTGIGIIHSLENGTVLDAPPFYPGYKAGIRRGDIILSLDTIGDYIYVTLLRDNAQFKYKIKVEKICYVEGEE